MKHQAASPLLLVGLAILSGCHQATAVEKAASTPPPPAIVFNLTSGGDNLHAVAMAFHLAEHSLADGRTTVLFFNVKAPSIASQKFSESATFGEGPPIRKQLQTLIRQGARAIVCPFCAKAVGLKEEELLPGVEMATREKLFGALHANSVVFTY